MTAMIYTDSMGHLISDTNIEELHRFAKKIGLKREWFQNHDIRYPHYDLTTENMKRKAVRFGAAFVSPKELVRKLNKSNYGVILDVLP